MIERRTPRLRWVGYTPTTVTPAQGSEPPGTVMSSVKAPPPPTTSPSSSAACIRSRSSTLEKRPRRSSSSAAPKYCPIPKIALPYSSRSLLGRTSNDMARDYRASGGERAQTVHGIRVVPRDAVERRRQLPAGEYGVDGFHEPQIRGRGARCVDR